MTGSLFELDVPDGFQYRPEFIGEDAEADLVRHVMQVEFSTFEMRGVAARRRVAFFGHSYDAERVASASIPTFLLPLRHRIADWARVDAGAFEMALINEYSTGTPIGWHRDAPQYGLVAGVSLLSSCRMKFRPYQSPAESAAEIRRATHEIVLARRSAYLMTGHSRSAYEHHIPAVKAPRYSITFRTLRPGSGSGH
jgi:alkylated DNA repair dioxygenase AlkB